MIRWNQGEVLLEEYFYFDQRPNEAKSLPFIFFTVYIERQNICLWRLLNDFLGLFILLVLFFEQHALLDGFVYDAENETLMETKLDN